MSIVRKLVLLAATVTAVSAFTTASASALSITQEPSAACPGNGCEIHIVSIGAVEFGSPLGMVFCNHELQANINSAGVGHIYQKQFSACTPIELAPCVSEWPVNVEETSLEVDLCIEVIGAPTNCHLILNIIENGHGYTFNTGASHRACENDPSVSIAGAWRVDGTGIEIVD